MKVTGQQPPVSQDIKTGQTQNKESIGESRDKMTLDAKKSVKTSSFTLDKIKDRIAAEPEVRSEKVAELKARIKSGEYQVDSQKLAGKILIESLQEDIS